MRKYFEISSNTKYIKYLESNVIDATYCLPTITCQTPCSSTISKKINKI